MITELKVNSICTDELADVYEICVFLYLLFD